MKLSKLFGKIRKIGMFMLYLHRNHKGAFKHMLYEIDRDRGNRGCLICLILEKDERNRNFSVLC